MPIINGTVGVSNYTWDKQNVFRGLFKMHFNITKGIINRYRSLYKNYIYIDMNAGPGRYSYEGQEYEGSPIIAKEEAKNIIDKAKYKTFGFELYAFEKEAELAESLVNNLNEIECINCQQKVFVTDNADSFWLFPELLNQSKQKKYGMIYLDPTGKIPDFSTLEALLKLDIFFNIDVLIYLAGASYKRVLYSPICKLDEALGEKLDKLNKRVWLVRKPHGKHQFTFLLGTNWVKFPEWPQQELYRIDSLIGQGYFNLINDRQRKEMTTC